MSRATRIEVENHIATDPMQTYRMFTNSTALREWLADQALASAFEKGPIYLSWSDGYQAVGQFTRLRPGEEVGFTWSGYGDPGTTKVKVSLIPDNGGTLVRVRQSGFKDNKAGRNLARALSRAWESSLENLASVMSDGADLRITRRPMLGIFTGEEVTFEKAGELGVDHGVRLEGVVDGMGAQAAGLASGDVLVSLGGAPVRNYAGLVAAVSPHHAGDEVAVEFYRGGEKHSVAMRLSGRPIPDMPRNPADLAAFLGDLYRRFQETLNKSLEGVSEEEAGHKRDGSWSIKENLAHLLADEVDTHARLVELVERNERLYDGAGGNSDLRMRVSAGSFPDTWAMLDSYRRAMSETVGLIGGLADDLPRSTFWRISFDFSQREDHLNEHLEAIRALRN
jgi:uncharacterized protein YndB with AHSA1/START domain